MLIRNRIRSAALGLSTALTLAAAPSFAATVKPSDEAVKSAGDKFDFAGWDKLTHKYVDDKGRVDYMALKGNAADMKELDQLYAQVGAQKLDALPSKNA